MSVAAKPTRVTGAHARFKELENGKVAFENEKRALAADMKELERKVETLDKTNERLMKDMEMARAKTLAAETVANSLLQNKNSKEVISAAKLQKTTLSLQELEDHNAELQAETLELNQNSSSLEDLLVRYAMLESEMAQLKKVAALNAREVKTKGSEEKKMKVRIAQLEADGKKMKERIVELEKAGEEKKARIAELEEACRANTLTIGKLEKKKNGKKNKEVAEKNKEVAEKDALIAKLQEDFKAAKASEISVAAQFIQQTFEIKRLQEDATNFQKHAKETYEWAGREAQAYHANMIHVQMGRRDKFPFPDSITAVFTDPARCRVKDFAAVAYGNTGRIIPATSEDAQQSEAVSSQEAAPDISRVRGQDALASGELIQGNMTQAGQQNAAPFLQAPSSGLPSTYTTTNLQFGASNTNNTGEAWAYGDVGIGINADGSFVNGFVDFGGQTGANGQ